MAQAKAKTTSSSTIKEGKFYVTKDDVVSVDTRGDAKPYTCVIRLRTGDQVKLKSLSELVYL